jgi:hypothetical protein
MKEHRLFCPTRVTGDPCQCRAIRKAERVIEDGLRRGISPVQIQADVKAIAASLK